MIKSPKRVVYREPFEDDPDEVPMEFRLTFEGRLRASNTGERDRKDGRKDYKHLVRQHIFHPQLKQLWEIVPFLKRAGSGSDVMLWESSRGDPDYRPEALAQKHAVGGYPFVPLVTVDLDLRCSLDILVLWRPQSGQLINKSDIDNRLKTLFDILSMPDHNQGYEKRLPEPPASPEPIYVLLEDDKLITKVSVETDLLLAEVPWDLDEFADTENDARVVITVRARPQEPSIHNLQFA